MTLLTFRKECFEERPLAGVHGPGEVLEEEVSILLQETFHVVGYLWHTCYMYSHTQSTLITVKSTELV